MNRRQFLSLPAFGPLPPALAQPQPAPAPIPEPHFPSRLYQFVWRNWELANTPRLAQVLRTSEANVLQLGRAMGLPEKRALTPDQLRRLHITVIRQNWHLLPESQIIELLGWDRPRYEFTLKEDDFLDVKLGYRKPECAPLTYADPSPQERKDAGRMRGIVRQAFGSALDQRGQDLFHFVHELASPGYVSVRDASLKPGPAEVDLTRGWGIREPGDPVLAPAVNRFRQYIRQAMRAELAGGPNDIVLQIAPGSDGFRIEVSEKRVLVTGGGSAEVIQGIYWLQDRMDRREAPFLEKGSFGRKAVWDPRFLYSYVALYGDPLMDPSADPFPDGYLEQLARSGINGVWLQAVLNTLAPSQQFPEFGEGWQTRLKNLNALVQRARGFGVRVYLYLNEPRAMPPAFFDKRPGIRGTPFQGLHAMCTSTETVREWIASSLANVVRHVPEIGGFFSITMSENHTNCFSHGGAWGKAAPVAKGCPRCSERTGWDVIAELLRTFRDGVRRASPAPDVIAWDWGWGDALAERLIPLLPNDIRIQSVSEWSLPLHRGGVPTVVGEYSISAVGPGPRATANWAIAKKHGLKTMARASFNSTWEISAVPYIPVPQLILEHAGNLRQAGISGVMASWTCGGYPSPNLAAVKEYYFEPQEPATQALLAAAVQRFGSAAAASVIEAWKRFSEAFREFPYGVAIYVVPVQHGPANLLRLQPTGYRPAMMLFPYDDTKAWAGQYPPDVAWKQFARMALLWKGGLMPLAEAVRKAPQAKKALVQFEQAIGETCYNHFQSTANQFEFYLLRDKLRSGAGERKPALERMRAIAEEEIELARSQFRIARHQSTIGFEASNHYYYTPLDLVEKVVNCRHLLDEELPDA